MWQVAFGPIVTKNTSLLIDTCRNVDLLGTSDGQFFIRA